MDASASLLVTSKPMEQTSRHEIDKTKFVNVKQATLYDQKHGKT